MSLTHPSFVLHGPAEPRTPLVLDSPHSGTDFPADFDAAVGESALRDGEDCFVDALWMPATERGVGLLAASAPRTYIDYNRHAGDIDLELLEGGAWPHAYEPSGKARLGKALVWRTLDDGLPIYARKLGVDEVKRRIDRYHQPYHHALARRIEATHARFGASWHIDCHSMNAVAGSQGEGGAGSARADVVLGDRDGTTCDPAFTELVRSHLAALGYDVRINDPFKGVELVRAYADPARRRMSLQLEVNKRLYMDEKTLQKTPGFERLQKDLASLVDAVLEHAAHATRAH
jgi:N-formylglutamate amidohydrolase